MFPPKMLLAVDGSEGSRRAAQLATFLAEGLGCELHVVRVEPMSGVYAYPEAAIYDPGLWDRVRETDRRTAREKLETEAGAMGLLDRAAGAHAPVGRPDTEIVRLAEDVRAGLIVVGSRGLGSIRRSVLGSVSDSVVRHAHCPVLVVRQDGPGGEGRLGPIVLAADGSDE